MAAPYFPELFFGITLLALCIATYTDLKARVVPNKLTYFLAGAGLALKAVESILSGSAQPLIFGLGGGAIAFGAGYLLYRLGVWAGGDVKLVAAIAVLNPVNYAVLGKITGLGALADGALATGNAFSGTGTGFGAVAGCGIFGTVIDLPIFGISLIIYSALMVLPLGFFMSFSAVFSHREVLERSKKALLRQSITILGAAILYTGLFAALSLALANFSGGIFLPALPLLTLLLILGAAMLPDRAKKIAVGLFGIAGIALLGPGFFETAIRIALPLLFGYGIWRVYLESREYAFRQTVKSSELEEGMVPDKLIIERGGKIEFEETPSARSVINQFMANKIRGLHGDPAPGGRMIFSPTQAGGLSEQEAEELKALAAGKKIPQQIRVRRTMAFVPAVLLGYIILQLTGDVLWKALF